MPVWNDAMEIAEEIHALTERLPAKEDFGLTAQLRRAALSISANIAEAYGRNHTADKINFYYFARGSATETQSHLEYAKRVKYFTADTIAGLNNKLNKIYNDLNKVIIALKH